MPSGLYSFVNAPLSLAILDIPGMTAIDEISTTEQWSNEGFSATQVLQCPWAQRNTLIKALLGDARRLGFGGGGNPFTWFTEITRAMKYRPIETPSFPQAIAVRATATPFDSPGDITTDPTKAQPATARVTITYETREYDQVANFPSSGGYYITEQLEGATEFLTVPPDGKLFWTQGSPPTDEVKIDEIGGRLIKMQVWIVTFRWLATVPVPLWDFVNTTNAKSHKSTKYDKTFDGDLTFGGDLLYGTPTLIPKITPGGTEVWDIEIPMTRRPFGWNKFYRPGQQDPVPMYNDDGSEFIQHPPVDWSGLVPRS